MTDLEHEILRTPPHSQADEAAVLGALLDEYSTLDDLPWLRVEHFHVPRHRALFLVLDELRREGARPQAQLVMGLLAAAVPHLENPQAFLAETANAAALGDNVRWHANALLDYHRRRKLLEAAYEVAQLAREWDGDTRLLADKATELVDQAVHRPDAGERSWSGEQGAKAVMDHVEAVRRQGGLLSIPLGLGGYAEALSGGWLPGQLVVVAGRPSMGKSALGLWFALCAAEAGFGAEVYSLEMPRLDVFVRLHAAVARLDSRAIKRAKLEGAHLGHDAERRLLDAMDHVAGLPLWVTDKGGLTVRELAARIKRRATRDGAKLFVVDYLQLVQGGGRHQTRNDEVGHVSRTLKQVAIDCGATVIAVCQLNRKVEDRGDKRPLMSDLRESGQLEQDADAICLVFREDYYRKDAENPGQVELHWAKNRDGETGLTLAHYDRPTSRFQGR